VMLVVVGLGFCVEVRVRRVGAWPADADAAV